MSESAPTPENTPAHSHSAGLADLASFPLLSAIQGRRTRRIARGISINAGDISHQSQNQPEPLSPLEEAILVVSTGLTGGIMHDGPLVKPDGRLELGTPFMGTIGRSGSSPDNAQATSFFMLNDEGTWLIKKLGGKQALELMRELPRKWSDWTEEQWIGAAREVKLKVYDQRVDCPREWPYYIGWNKQFSNCPGSTVFVPVVDMTYQYINAFLILGSEPRGDVSIFVDDYSKFRPKNVMDWVAWAGMHLRLTELIPYHPIGGVKLIRSGLVNKDNTVPLGYGRTLRTDLEWAFMVQNMALLGHTMGLGSWVHASIFPPYLMQRDPAKGIYGLGFREHGPKLRRFKRWPPVPASIPNFVGIDGVLEGLCPPYVASMDEAVDRVLELKFGPDGAYGDKQTFSTAYKNTAAAEAFLKDATPHSDECIRNAKQICNYIYDTYGRFPAHSNAFYLPAVWIQFSHLELEYYEKYADASFYERQARHDGVWHGDNGSGG